MTRKEFCELMAAGHEEAAAELGKACKQAREVGAAYRARNTFVLVQQEEALARAFRDLAKEQDQ